VAATSEVYLFFVAALARDLLRVNLA
jgi:hypothetical protein